MEKELIGENELNALKKKNTGLIVFFILWTLLIAGWITLVFLLQNRSTEYLWLYLGAIVTTLLIVVLLYVFTKMATPLWAYMKFMAKCESKDHQINDVTIVEEQTATITYQGILTKQLNVKEVDEGNIWTVSYQADEKLELKKGKTYQIETYDDVLIRIKEEQR
jgi:hypothetical protein